MFDSSFYTVCHFSLCPFSRKVRIFLNEYKINYELLPHANLQQADKILEKNPIAKLPILMSEDIIIYNSNTICEYIEDLRLFSCLPISGLPNEERMNNEERMDNLPYSNFSLIGGNPQARAGIRALVNWLDCDFYSEVVSNILHEKIVGFLDNSSLPDSSRITASKKMLSH